MSIDTPWSSGHGWASLGSPCFPAGQSVFPWMPWEAMAMEQSFTLVADQTLALQLSTERTTA